MTSVSRPSADAPVSMRLVRAALLLSLLCWLFAGSSTLADPIASARCAYARGNFVQAVNRLTPLALRGNVDAQAMLGFMYENGFGAPQAYDAAADLYTQAAIAGNPFAQAMLGLMYDKGHGVPLDVVLAYKWLNLAAGRAGRLQRAYYIRLRNAVASKMSVDQIAQGQALALAWAPGRW
ncbi:tetratricopeptide repeat protein [Bradyrhizobium sp. ISRA442]|uniref:tetratricopeptide repeat protein n=1 Tax=Bradyrhizobium sp. ISRA442 TaxID=2866197 RepID=UPI00404AC622